MKTVLAILLSFVIADAPTLVFGRYVYSLDSSSQSLVGTYAGALVPVSDTLIATSGSTSATGFGTNSLGLFTLSIPSTGLGAGTVVIFSDQQELQGSIEAIQDPSNANGGIVGVINATGQITTSAFNFGAIGFSGSTTEVTGNAGGSFDATSNTSETSISPTGLNLTGTANLSVSTAVTGTDGTTTFTPTETIVFSVDGFQQSTVATTTSGS